MPELFVYDETATLVATEAATSISSGGSQATFPFPSSLQQNGYTVAVANQTGSSPGISAVGTNYLSIASSTTIAGNPFGVAVADQTDNDRDVDTCERGTTYSTNNLTVPVVSLYSQNQVLINGQPVAVGQNPTAVAAYTGPQVNQTSSDDCDDFTDQFTGQTQGIVANSGSNTVSILDLVNDAVLSTITVGHQPVALVVSSDGGTAYVANYTDSTVTKINLTTDSPTTTIAVGGQPTSVALTAAGILWAGGVGFLTEVNASSMTVVATESSSRTISALAYTDAYNELIATSMDSGGNVYVDSISPSSVTAGGVYTPAASHEVSTLGTYFNPIRRAETRGLTATVTTSSVPIVSTQPGAPPLVVQDGWAVVSATPTGFTISDASGNVVLVSETTPSPIAAIAVDPSLNVAYLTMPDSNTLLTVPLPGTGTN
jgi:YVTN family beta-propeller protein